MGIFTDNPVLEREVRGRLRFKRTGSLRTNIWVARILGLVVAYYAVRGLVGIARGTVQDARDFWPLLVYGALVLSVLLAPALAATAITQEREQQTWEILATTQLSAYEVLGGKWLGRQIILWLMLLLLLPFMVVDAVRAGFSPWLLPAVLGFLLLTIACYSALGLLCSFGAKRTMTATASALTVSAALCIGTVVVNWVTDLLVFRGANGDTPVLCLNPFYAVGSLMGQFAPGAVGSENSNAGLLTGYLVLTLAATAAALAFMVRRYHRSVRERS